MNNYNTAICIVGICLVITALVIFINHLRTKKTIDRIENMLNEAAKGNFSEKSFDETRLSSLESRFAHYLSASVVSASNVELEKDKIKSLIADISHQIRTPLTAINLIVSRLRGEKNEADRHRLLHELEQLLVHMDWLIEALLKMAKLDAGTVSMKKKTVNVSDLLKKSVQDFLIPMELREQNLVIDCTDMVSLRGDEYWLREAVGNIVKNCMEHTPAGGEICIRAAENHLYTEITVSDNGAGIDKEDLPHIFERFYKGKNSADSSVGIGLALARMIVVAQEGTLSATNRINGGAKFEIRFYKGTV